MIKELQTLGYRVAGCEGFLIEGRSISPQLDLIFDASSRWDGKSASEVVGDWPEGVWVDLNVLPQKTAGAA